MVEEVKLEVSVPRFDEIVCMDALEGYGAESQRPFVDGFPPTGSGHMPRIAVVTATIVR